MRAVSFFLLISQYLHFAEHRLIRKNTIQLNTEATVVNFSQSHRVTRDVYEEDGVEVFSTEDGPQFEPMQKRTKNKYLIDNFYSKTKHDGIRLSRKAGTSVTDDKKNKTKLLKAHQNNSIVKENVSKTKIAKKPTPNFSDTEYDETFIGEVPKVTRGLPDSNEHEDQDFNVDDYDFDINHDEFSGQGKPLIPIKKLTDAKQPTGEKKAHSVPSPIAGEFVNLPQKIKKRQPLPRISTNMKIAKYDDDYDDVTTVQAPPDDKTDGDDSLESMRVKSAVRAIRSSMLKEWCHGKAMEKYQIKLVKKPMGLFSYKFFKSQ